MSEPLSESVRTDADPVAPLRLEERPRVSSPSPSADIERRTRLFSLSVGLVEDLRREGIRPGPGPEGFCDEFQVCLPYRGLFVWHVAGEDVVGDSTQVVFVRGGESYRMGGPLRSGYSELIITPDLEVLDEIAGNGRRPLADHPLFVRRTGRADARLQSFRTRFLHWAKGSPRDTLAAEELVLALLRSTFNQRGGAGRTHAPTSARLIRSAKEYLAAALSSRVLLADVARAVGASPAYLTDLFRRAEGVSLHQYLTDLRLARALTELPHANDLTTLALDLGFSSHSHFSATFRRAFQCTPSSFRQMLRAARQPIAAAVPVTAAAGS